MSSLAVLADASWSFVKRDTKILLSYRLRLAAMLLSVFFSLTLFYYVSRLVSVRQFESPDEYYAFVVVGVPRIAGSTGFPARVIAFC